MRCGNHNPVNVRCGLAGKPTPDGIFPLWCGGHNMGLQCGNHKPIGIGAWKSQTRWGCGLSKLSPATMELFPQRQLWCGNRKPGGFICDVLLLVSPSPTELWCGGHNMGLQYGNHKSTGIAACEPQTRWGCNMDTTNPMGL